MPDWLVKILAAEIVNLAAAKVAAFVKYLARKFKNKGIETEQKNADTKEERDRAVQDVVNQYNDDGK